MTVFFFISDPCLSLNLKYITKSLINLVVSCNVCNLQWQRQIWAVLNLRRRSHYLITTEWVGADKLSAFQMCLLTYCSQDMQWALLQGFICLVHRQLRNVFKSPTQQHGTWPFLHFSHGHVHYNISILISCSIHELEYSLYFLTYISVQYINLVCSSFS